MTAHASILSALVAYYERLRKDQSIPEPGYSREKIHFALMLEPDGAIAGLQNLQTPNENGKGLRPKSMIVPKDKDRSSDVHPYVAWEKTDYLFGVKKDAAKQNTALKFDAFKKHNNEVLKDVVHPAVKAFLSYLSNWNLESASSLSNWQDAAGLNFVIKLRGYEQYLHEISEVEKAWLRYYSNIKQGHLGICLVTGEHAPISEKHPFRVRGVHAAQKSGAALVSFNVSAFTSYNKGSSYNAPVSEQAAFAYITALNHMLATGGVQSQQTHLGGAAEHLREQTYGGKTPPPKKQLVVGDATTVFWSEKPHPAEAMVGSLMNGVQEDNNDSAHDKELVDRLRTLLQALRSGKQAHVEEDDTDIPFYVLGLAPNAARISVRFWHVSTVADIQEKLARHFDDLAIERRYEADPEFPGMWRLLIETAPLRKTENIPPNLGGEIMRAIITGASYPLSLVSRVLGRLRAEKEITTLRAALLKAYYVRAMRQGKLFKNISHAEVDVSLNENSTNIGYRLGRLFAVMEKAQRDALGHNLNASIKDRFFGAASATPGSVFPRLIKLAQHHIAKSEYGYVSDRAMAQIIEGMEAKPFPPHLSIDDQAMFALGYYHQRNDLYPKREKDTDKTAAEAAA